MKRREFLGETVAPGLPFQAAVATASKPCYREFAFQADGAPSFI